VPVADSAHSYSLSRNLLGFFCLLTAFLAFFSSFPFYTTLPLFLFVLGPSAALLLGFPGLRFQLLQQRTLSVSFYIRQKSVAWHLVGLQNMAVHVGGISRLCFASVLLPPFSALHILENLTSHLCQQGPLHMCQMGPARVI